MICDGGCGRNVYIDDILLLMYEWDAEDCMDLPYTIHMIQPYVLKYQSHDTDTPDYMMALSSEHADE